MKSFSTLTFLAALCMSLVPTSNVLALPVDLSIPSGGLGPTRSDGAAEHWLELGEFEFGQGLALPLRVWFDSDRTTPVPDFGSGSLWWRSPVLHARVLTSNDTRVSIMLPCGKILVMDRNGDHIATPDGEWSGRYAGKNLLVSREDGWELEFNADKWLIRLRTDTGRTLLWERQPNGLLTAVREAGKEVQVGKTKAMQSGVAGLMIKRATATGLITSITARTSFGLKTYAFSYDNQQRLAGVTLADGSQESYAYSTTAEGHPQMTVTSRSLVDSILVWDKSSRKLRSDGVWSYDIESSYSTTNPKMVRRGPQGETETYLDDSTKSGQVIFTAADSTTTTRQMVLKGAAKGKLESVTRTLAGKSPVTTFRATFDDLGSITTETDALGHKTTHAHTYWGKGPQSGIKTHTRTDATGAVIKEEFDQHANLIASIDALGNTFRFSYDAQNRRTQTTGPDGTVVESLSYTPQGRVASRTDAVGAVTKFGYDKDGNRTTTIDALGHETKDEFDARGNRLKSTDALGNTWSYEYDKGNRLVRTVAPDGQETERRVYNKEGRLITVIDAAGNTTRTEYDTFGRVTARTDALDRTTRYAYDVTKGAVGCQACNASSMPTLITLPSGRKIQRAYDADKHLIAETIAFGTAQAATTKHVYDLAGNLLATTDPLGRVTRHDYDAAGRRVKTTFPDQTTKTFAHDAAGQLTAETDELGHTTRRSYDAYRNLIAQTDAADNTTRYFYGSLPAGAPSTGSAALHRPDATATSEGRLTRTTYDLLGHRLTQTTGEVLPASDNTKSQIPNPKSSVPSVVKSDTDVATAKHVYDATGNEIETTDPVGKVTKHTYDARKRRLTTTDALGRVWKYSYTASAGASGNPPCCGADPTNNARAQTTTFPDGTTESRITDAAGQLIETKDAKGDSVKYAYDPDGRLTTLTDARGSITRWTYDPRGKLESKAYPDKTFEAYEHDAAGQLLTRTRPDGTAAINTYDQRGRLLSTVWKRTAPADPTAPQLPGESRYAYDKAGHLTSATNPSAEILRTYTATGRIETETQKITASFDPASGIQDQASSSYKVAYTYTPDGKIASLRYPNDLEVAYTYTPRGQLAAVSERGTENPEPRTVATYTYRPNNQPATLTLANGVKTVKTYDAVGRLEKVMHLPPGGTELWSETSRYDQRDRRTARIHTDGQADLFAYDPAGQVIAAAYGQAKVASASAEPTNPNSPPKPETWQQTFAYDPAGNRKAFQDLDGTKTDYQTNEANQYTAVADHAPRYDKNGNLLADTKNTYTWDADIHLLSVTTKAEKNQDSGIKNQESTTRFAYDALHRRVARLEPDGTLTQFIHDGWNVLEERSSNHKSKIVNHKSFVWGTDISGTAQGAGGIAGLLASQTFSPTEQREGKTLSLNPSPLSLFFHYDSNGNVVLLTTTDGKETARYSYDAFGKTLTATGEAAQTNKYRFSTKPIEDGSGLAFYGFRYYSPDLGRWTARDPSTQIERNVFTYRFSSNNGVIDRDTLGLLSCEEEWASKGEFQWEYQCCGGVLHKRTPGNGNTYPNFDTSSMEPFMGVCCGNTWLTPQDRGTKCCSGGQTVVQKVPHYLQYKDGEQACIGGQMCIPSGYYQAAGGVVMLAGFASNCRACAVAGAVVWGIGFGDWALAVETCNRLECPDPSGY